MRQRFQCSNEAFVTTWTFRWENRGLLAAIGRTTRFVSGSVALGQVPPVPWHEHQEVRHAAPTGDPGL